MSELDLTTAINRLIDECKQEINILKARSDYLNGLKTSIPPVITFQERWERVKSAINLIAFSLCTSVDSKKKDGKYNSVIVERKKGSDDYDWFITMEEISTTRKIPIPKSVGLIPMISNPETDLFIREMHRLKHIEFNTIEGVVDASRYHNDVRNGFQPKLNSLDFP